MPKASDQVITQTFLDQVEAIRLCMNNKLHLPALILIYSCIDFAASLCRPVQNEEVNSTDFIAWVGRYMDCEVQLDVKAVDLYAARCGILHTNSANSRLWKNNKANRIFYTWGDRTPHSANDLIKRLGKPERFVSTSCLFEALISGIEKFVDLLSEDEGLRALAISRAPSVLTNVVNFLPQLHDPKHQ